jgi:hypothetical protein
MEWKHSESYAWDEYAVEAAGLQLYVYLNRRRLADGWSGMVQIGPCKLASTGGHDTREEAQAAVIAQFAALVGEWQRVVEKLTAAKQENEHG